MCIFNLEMQVTIFLLPTFLPAERDGVTRFLAIFFCLTDLILAPYEQAKTVSRTSWVYA